MLHIAAGKGKVKFILQSLQEFPQQLSVDMVDDNNRTMLFSSAEFGDFEDFVALLALYPDVNEWLKRDINGASIVHAACEVGKLLFLKELVLKFGAQCLMQTDNQGRTALHYACRSRNLSLIEWLVTEYKLSLTAEDSAGKIPFHMLAEAAEQRPQRWKNLPALAKRYGMEHLTDYPDHAGMTVKNYLEAADQPAVLKEIEDMCSRQFARKF